MDLENIVLDFKTAFYSSLFNDEQYEIPVITNIEALKVQCETVYGFDVDNAVVQYTTSGTGVARIILSGGDNVPFIENLDLLPSLLTDQLDVTRTEVETHITNNPV